MRELFGLGLVFFLTPPPKLGNERTLAGLPPEPRKPDKSQYGAQVCSGSKV